ncbi:MAG: rhodanese-like domain-containing protein [Candidatus Nanopelagicales bacterium]
MIDQITTDQLHDRMATTDVTLLDVREVHEFREGHVPGAINIPLSLVPVRVHELPTDGDLVVICRSGSRSQQACMWLATQGRPASNVTGGTVSWISSSRPVETGVPA